MVDSSFSCLFRELIAYLLQMALLFRRASSLLLFRRDSSLLLFRRDSSLQLFSVLDRTKDCFRVIRLRSFSRDYCRSSLSITLLILDLRFNISIDFLKLSSLFNIRSFLSYQRFLRSINLPSLYSFCFRRRRTNLRAFSVRISSSVRGQQFYYLWLLESSLFRALLQMGLSSANTLLSEPEQASEQSWRESNLCRSCSCSQ